MTYQEQTTTLAETVSAQVLAALAAYTAGKLTAGALIAVVAAYVAAGNSAGAALGDLSLAAAVSLSTGEAVAPAGITRPTIEPKRLASAARTILEDLDRQTAEDRHRPDHRTIPVLATGRGRSTPGRSRRLRLRHRRVRSRHWLDTRPLARGLPTLHLVVAQRPLMGTRA